MCRGEEIESLVSRQSALLTHNKDYELLQGKRKRRGYLTLEADYCIVHIYTSQSLVPYQGSHKAVKIKSVGKTSFFSRFSLMWQQGCVKTTSTLCCSALPTCLFSLVRTLRIALLPSSDQKPGREPGTKGRERGSMLQCSRTM